MRLLVLTFSLTAVAASGGAPKTAALTRVLSDADSALAAAPFLEVLAALQASLERVGLRCSSASRLRDGIDPATARVRRGRGAVSPLGVVPPFSATLMCTPDSDGGHSQSFDVGVRVSLQADDRVNPRPRYEGPIVFRSEQLLMFERPLLGFGLLIASFDEVDGGALPGDRPVLAIELGRETKAVAARIARALDSNALAVALRKVLPLPGPGALALEVPKTRSHSERLQIERAVVSTVLTHAVGSEPVVVTDTVRGGNLAAIADYRRLAPDLRESLFAEFESRRDSATLPPLPEQARFVSEKQLRKVLHGPGTWEEFHRIYRGIERVVRLSPVALSADGTQALMYLEWQGGPLYGHGATYILTFSGGAWQVVYEIGHWVS